MLTISDDTTINMNICWDKKEVVWDSQGLSGVNHLWEDILNPEEDITPNTIVSDSEDNQYLFIEKTTMKGNSYCWDFVRNNKDGDWYKTTYANKNFKPTDYQYPAVSDEMDVIVYRFLLLDDKDFFDSEVIVLAQKTYYMSGEFLGYSFSANKYFDE